MVEAVIYLDDNILPLERTELSTALNSQRPAAWHSTLGASSAAGLLVLSRCQRLQARGASGEGRAVLMEARLTDVGINNFVTLIDCMVF